MNQTTPGEPTPAYRAYVLFILVVVYTFNFIDRQIIGILAIDIKAELGLTDSQIGLMSGLAFGLLYCTLGIPIAALADRKSRTWIMTIALTVWSGFTAVCGLAQNYTQLFLARLGVGVGEAGGVAPAYSLISDYFPREKRARALAIYAFGIPLGSALGIIIGGVLVTQLSWRETFFYIGLAGVLVAPIFRLTMREPMRGRYDKGQSVGIPEREAGDVCKYIYFLSPTIWSITIVLAVGLFTLISFLVVGWELSIFVFLGLLITGGFLHKFLLGQRNPLPPETSRGVIAVLDTLVRKPSFWGLSFGAAFSSMMGYGLFLWVPSFLVRSFENDLPGFFSFLPGFLLPDNPPPVLYAAYFYGAIILLGGILGIWLGGFLADKYGEDRKSVYALVPGVAFLVQIPILAAGLLSNSLGLTFVVLLFPSALGLMWLGPVTSAFQHLVPLNMRATASAVFLFVNNLIGIGIGQWALGAISDGLKARFAEESLRYAILSGCSFYLIAGALMLITAPRLKKDWVG